MHLTAQRPAAPTTTALVSELDATETIAIAVGRGVGPAGLRAHLEAGSWWPDLDHRHHPERYHLRPHQVGELYSMNLTSIDMGVGALWTLHGTVAVPNPDADPRSVWDQPTVPCHVSRTLFSFYSVEVLRAGPRGL